MNHFFCSLLFFFLLPNSLTLQAQHLQGSLQHADSGKAIPYAHIGVVNTSLGTITDEAGNFLLPLPGSTPDSSRIYFSAVGFRSREIPIGKIKKESRIMLEPALIELPEVTVVDRQRSRVKSAGHYGTTRKIVTGWSQAVSRGGIRAARIKLPNRASDALLESFRFHLAYNEYDSLLLRLHFFYPDPTGKLPGEAIPLAKDIFIYHGNTTGEVTLDLKPWQILVTGDFFVGLEVVRVYGNCTTRECLHFSVVLFKERIYYRNTVTEAWESNKLGGPAFEVTLRY